MGYIDDQEDEEFSLDSNQLTKRMKHFNNVLNHFWKHWRSEYLVELREAHSYTAKKQSSTSPSGVEVGDIVVVHDDHLPRGFWKLGRIDSIMKGKDGHIRGATVKVASKGGCSMLLNRPIQLLFPLEVKCQEPTTHSPGTAQDSSSPADGQPSVPEPDSDSAPIHSRRSSRKAAKDADERRKVCMFELEDD